MPTTDQPDTHTHTQGAPAMHTSDVQTPQTTYPPATPCKRCGQPNQPGNALAGRTCNTCYPPPPRLEATVTPVTGDPTVDPDDATTTTCPTCHALPGAPCTGRPNGGNTHLGLAHRARFNNASRGGTPRTERAPYGHIHTTADVDLTGAPAYLTRAQLADLLQMSVKGITKREEVGTIPAGLRIGRSVRYSRAAITAWLEANTPR